MKVHQILLTAFISWLIAGCNTPTEGFERTNIYDPYSPSFGGGTVTGLQVSADKSGIILVRWRESVDIVSKNVLEKSLGDSLNFTPIAELNPDIRQFADSSLAVRKNTYYRLSSYIELAGGEYKLYGSSQAVLTFGEILNKKVEFQGENNSLQLSWNTDVPFYTHFIVSSENVISEQQEKSVRIPAEGIEHGFMDPLPDIDFETRNYTITGIIEHDGIDEAVIEQEISFDAATFFQPEFVEIDVLNEQDWKVTWQKPPFFATEIEVTRFSFTGDIFFKIPADTPSFIDSLLVENTQSDRYNQYRKYQVRYLTNTGASPGITKDATIDILAAAFLMPGIDDTDPNSLNLRWVAIGNDINLIKEFIIEKSSQLSPDDFQEYARVSAYTYQYTDTNVNDSEEFIYRISTVTSRSTTRTFAYYNRFELDYLVNTEMNYVTSMQVSSDKRYLAYLSFRSGQGNTIRVMDIVSKRDVAFIGIASRQTTGFKITSDDRYIYFTVPSEGAIYRADFPTGDNKIKVIDDASIGSAGFFHIDVSSDGTFLIGTGGPGFVKRWNLDTYEAGFIFEEYNSSTFYQYKNIAISPGGEYIGGNNGILYIMDSENGTILKTMPSVSPNVTDIQFSADGRYFSFVEDFSRTHIYSTENWEQIQVINSKRADFHPMESKLVLSGGVSVFTYDLETLKKADTINSIGISRWPFTTSQLNAIKFMDENRIATVDYSNNIEIWKKTDVRGWIRIP